MKSMDTMKNDICFVSVGQCGGNIGSLFTKKGFDVLFMNTAKGDLDTLQGNISYSYHIPGSKGCNQDQTKAMGILSMHVDEVLNQIFKYAKKRIVYFIFSCGGGSGGGMTPTIMELFAERLKEQEDKEWDEYMKLLDSEDENVEIPSEPIHRKIGAIVALPSLDETAQLNGNAYKCMKSLLNLVQGAITKEVPNFCNVFLLDNENSADKLRLNTEFVTEFCNFLKIPSQHHSQLGNVDEADLESAITEPGITILSILPKNEDDTQSIINSIRHNKILAGSEDKTGVYWLTSTVKPVDVTAMEKVLGAPKTHYYTFNDCENYILVSGLGFPEERLSLLADRAKEFKDTVRKSMYDIVETSLDEDLDFLDTDPVIKKPCKPQMAAGKENQEVSQSEEKKTAKSRLDMFRRMRRPNA